jgi:hypothetical protein
MATEIVVVVGTLRRLNKLVAVIVYDNLLDPFLCHYKIIVNL